MHCLCVAHMHIFIYYVFLILNSSSYHILTSLKWMSLLMDGGLGMVYSFPSHWHMTIPLRISSILDSVKFSIDII